MKARNEIDFLIRISDALLSPDDVLVEVESKTNDWYVIPIQEWYDRRDELKLIRFVEG